jgi:hypothetical protein
MASDFKAEGARLGKERKTLVLQLGEAPLTGHELSNSKSPTERDAGAGCMEGADDGCAGGAGSWISRGGSPRSRLFGNDWPPEQKGQKHPAGRYVRFGTCNTLKRPVGTVATVADTVAGAGLDGVVRVGPREQ